MGSSVTQLTPNLLLWFCGLCGTASAMAALPGSNSVRSEIEVTSVAPSAVFVDVLAVSPTGSTDSATLTLRGQARKGQRIVLAQRGFVFFEQTLARDGPFVIKEVVPLNERLPVVFVLIDPDGTQESTKFSMLAGQRHGLGDNAQTAPTEPAQAKTGASPTADDNDAPEFDASFLRGSVFRNLTPAQLRSLGRARPGSYLAEVFRNEQPIGKFDVKFSRHPTKGEALACVSPALYQQLGVDLRFTSAQGKELLKPTKDPGDPTDCLVMEDWMSGARSDFNLGELRLDIAVPQAYVTRENLRAVPPEMLDQGTTAAFVNYSLNSYNAQSGDSRTESQFLNLSTGVNLGPWRARQSSYLSKDASGATQTVNGELLLKRSLVGWQAQLALGQTSTWSPVLGSTPITGVRLGSEEMLLPDDERSFNTVVRGVARGNATVRIRQNNVVFFEQNVPAGPFEFTRLYPPSTLGDLQVTVTEADGSETRSVVPYAYNGGKLNPGSYRYSLAVGNYRGGNNTAETPLLHGYVRYGLNDTWTPTAEAIASANYQAMGLQASLYNKFGTFSASTRLARQSTPQERSGAAYNAYYYAPPLGPVNLYGGLSYQTEKFVSPNTGLGQLSSTSAGAAASFESSSYLGLSLNMGSYGGLYANARRQTNWNQSAAPEQYSLGYNLFRNSMFFSANLDRSSGGFAGASVDTVRLSISVPLDIGSNKGWLAASASQQGNYGVAQSINYNGNSEDNSLSYGLSHSGQDGQSSSGGSVGYQHPYGFAGLSLSTGNNFSQTGLGLSGSLVAHRGGLTLAPPVGDTFAIVEVPNGEGARVNGSNAQVGASGYGVVSYLSPYSFNDVALNLENAPMDLEVDTASQRVAPLDGSIVLLRFKANRGRPLLLQLTLDKGGRLPLGASVLDAQDQEVGQVGQASKAVVRVKGDAGRLTVVWGDKPEQRCTLDYQLSAKNVANASGMTPLALTCTQAPQDTPANAKS